VKKLMKKIATMGVVEHHGKEEEEEEEEEDPTSSLFFPLWEHLLQNEDAAEADTRSRAKRRETPPTSRAFSSPKERVIKETPVSSPITLHPRRKERAKSRTPPTFRAYFSPKEGVNTEKPVSFPLRRKCARLHPPHKKA